ncbi:sperm-associated antigen 7 homolog [Coccinella septempunctata]|uniref:sperm-associated antigen 7 homolog n=1 Tax=Coccinella septempunctata TaxID=41139 RepID=UPI001D0841F8|nr:sperm-associated antigen 7 homolog [Coccinella septempunctata]
MDLLGSILSSMDKPPTMSDRDREMKKKKKEFFEKHQAAEKDRLQRFKERLEEKILKHFEDKNNTTLKFDPMDAIQRSIVHEIAENQNLLAYAFGEDGVDRYMRLYRKDHPPCEDELAARRRGEPWNEEIKQQLLKQRQVEQSETTDSHNSRKRKQKFIPNSNYKDKYAHIIGQEAALEGAKNVGANKSYGFVPSENKKDVRSIEQAMADIRAKKKQKLDCDKVLDDC